MDIDSDLMKENDHLTNHSSRRLSEPSSSKIGNGLRAGQRFMDRFYIQEA